MRLDDPERAGALVVVLVFPILFGVVLVVAAHQPPPPPPPETDIVGLLRGVATTLSPLSAPSTKPGESAATPSIEAPSVLASPPPSAAASAAPASAARAGRRAQPSGPVSRKPGAPGASEIVNPWGSHE